MEIQDFQKLTNKHESTIIGALLVIGVIAAYNWVVRPHVTLLLAAQHYKRAANQRIETMKVVNDDVRTRGDELEGLLAERSKRSQMVFDANEADEFLRRLQPLCREAGCCLVSLTYPEPEEITALVEQPMTDTEDEPDPVPVLMLVARRADLEIQGHYESLVRLIGMLQSRRQKVWIDELRISTARSDAGSIACNLGITIYVANGKEMECDE